MADRIIRNSGPVQTCQTCGDYERAVPGRGFPPDIAKRTPPGSISPCEATMSDLNLAELRRIADEGATFDFAFGAALDPPTVLALIDRLEAAEAKVQRVREIHAPIGIERGGTRTLVQVCEGCWEMGNDMHPGVGWGGEDYDACAWPCPTIRGIEAAEFLQEHGLSRYANALVADPRRE